MRPQVNVSHPDARGGRQAKRRYLPITRPATFSLSFLFSLFLYLHSFLVLGKQDKEVCQAPFAPPSPLLHRPPIVMDGWMAQASTRHLANQPSSRCGVQSDAPDSQPKGLFQILGSYCSIEVPSPDAPSTRFALPRSLARSSISRSQSAKVPEHPDDVKGSGSKRMRKCELSGTNAEVRSVRKQRRDSTRNLDNNLRDEAQAGE